MQSDERVDVVVRCRNEMPFTRATLDMLSRQEHLTVRILFIDCGSTDGSREAAEGHGCEIVDLDPFEYIPGRVLNMGMRRTESDVVAFVNADAVPADPFAISKLVTALRQTDAAAAIYGRQLARPNADRLTRLDYLRAFGPEDELTISNGRFFSMAASAISRAVWSRLPFDEALRYSEDVDWINRASALGWNIMYAPGACFQHSHNYDVRGHFKRRLGEGVADNRIFRLGPPSLLREWARPLAGSLLRDVRSGILTPHSLLVRFAQASGYYMGRRGAASSEPRSR